MHMNISIEENNWCKVKLMIILRREKTDKLYSLDLEKGLGHAVAIENPISADSTRIRGSCNGLLCMLFNLKLLYIWNPSTRECKEVPCLPPNDDYIIEYGFGYNPDIDDYVVVRISSCDPRKVLVEVYSLRRNSWRTISTVFEVYSLHRNSGRTIPHRIPYTFEKGKSGVFVEGSLHWVVHRPGIKYGDVFRTVIAFDIGRERFRELPLPEYGTRCKSIEIVESGGKLYMQRYLVETDSELWVMKVYGVKESWTKLFNIPAHLSGSLLCIKRNGSVLLKGDNLDVILYDPKTKTRSFNHIPGICEGIDDARTYVESTVRV
ncbi:hypothetical protein AQUCO_00700025v1 [Aquilegia coerulea]|uniref:F-box associated beta-propeller type 1 domain-containing protein n=1 Tax=Aquilegia coerulea TaxID=218851 RepID=A0A2G5EIB9_AQUCA|nr:hypothetical protein AQUCO_00700025v1 [Aquilegia coerulea]